MLSRETCTESVRTPTNRSIVCRRHVSSSSTIWTTKTRHMRSTKKIWRSPNTRRPFLSSRIHYVYPKGNTISILKQNKYQTFFKSNSISLFFKNRSVTPQQWLAFSKYNKDRSDAEMETSKRLRENIQQLIAQSNSDMDSQKNSTEYAMRKRIHETEQAKDELSWQKKNVCK